MLSFLKKNLTESPPYLTYIPLSVMLYINNKTHNMFVLNNKNL